MRHLFFKAVLIASGFLFVRCSNEPPSEEVLHGKWKATWRTSATAFPEVGSDVSLTMNGWLDFSKEEVTITAYGYPGCIFSADTLQHSQGWQLKHDTLELINAGDVNGISYLMKKKSADSIELVLMGDIFLSLSRVE